MFKSYPNSHTPFQLFHEADTGTDPGGTTVVTPPQVNVKDAVRSAIAELLGAAKDDPAEALAISVRKSHALEQRAVAAERERDEFKGKLPAPDARVISAEDAQALERYRALGKAEELAPRTELEALSQVINEAIDDQTADWPDELKELLPGSDAMTASQRMAEVVKLKPLAEKLAPAQPAGVPLIRQSGGGGVASGKDLVSEKLKQQQEARSAAPNPLMQPLAANSPADANANTRQVAGAGGGGRK